MTEPQVLPAPKTKPVPKRETPKPKPRRDDPWTVPAPKVNPTPKAEKLNITVMKTKKYTTGGKMIIDNKSDLDVMKAMMTKEAFNKKCVLSMKLTAELLAADAVTYVAFTDVSSVYLAQEKAKLN